MSNTTVEISQKARRKITRLQYHLRRELDFNVSVKDVIALLLSSEDLDCIGERLTAKIQRAVEAGISRKNFPKEEEKE